MHHAINAIAIPATFW